MISQWSSYLIPVLIDAIAVLGLYVIVNSGRISAGHAAFVGIGSYCTAELTAKAQLPVLPAIIVTIVIGAAVGALFAVAVERLAHWFFSVSTIAFGFLVAGTVTNVSSLGGAIGLNATSVYVGLALVLVVLVVVVLLVFGYDQSRWGRASRVVRDDPIAARGLGINVTLIHARAFAIGSGIAALSGALKIGYLGFVTPDDLSVSVSLVLLVYLTIGGSQRIAGALLGTLVLGLLPAVNQTFGTYRLEIYGVLVVLIMVFRPDGVLGAYSGTSSMLAHAKRLFPSSDTPQRAITAKSAAD